MSAYRFLLGPISFLGVDVFEAQELSESGEMLSGAAADPAGAMAALEAEIERVRGGPTLDWCAAPGLRAALGLGEERGGWPSPEQREVMLVSSLFRSPVGALWPIEDRRVAEGALVGLSLFARRVASLPERRPFAYHAGTVGTLEGESFVVFSRRGARAQLAVVRERSDVSVLEETAAHEEEVDPEVNHTVASIDLTPSWLGAVMHEAFGVAFSPLLFQRRRGEPRTPVDDVVAILLGVMATAFPEGALDDASGEGSLAAGDEDLTCRLTPLSS
ncbi:MAG: hypothetical protein H6722_11515 [Sandaracinus sp.]|nr:hypothetical protein [Sandaracinus sp.]